MMPVTGGTKGKKKKKKDEIWGEQTLLQLQLNKNLQLSYGALMLIEQQKYKEKKNKTPTLQPPTAFPRFCL